MSRIEEMLERIKQPDAQEMADRQMEAQREKWRNYRHEHAKRKAVNPNYRGYRKRWLEMKARVRFIKLRIPCQQCGSASDLEVSHKIPLHQEGDFKRTNLQWLCHPCHIRYDQYSYS